MSGMAELQLQERNIIASATHVSGNIWVLATQIRNAESLVTKGYLIRVGRTHFRLTDKGFDAKRGK